jgi:hypothetical protein
MNRNEYTVARYSPGPHPAGRVVEQWMAGLSDGDIPFRNVYPWVGKLPWTEVRSKRRKPILLVPLMGPKFWILKSALRRGNYVIPYCWDVWAPDENRWLEELAHPAVAGVICSSSDAQRMLSASLRKPVLYLPEALAVVRYPKLKPPPLGSRTIDVLELGRRHASWHGLVKETLERRGYVHHYEKQPGNLVVQDADGLDRVLLDAKVSLCFTRHRTHPDSSGEVVAMTQRFLESMALGCIPLGDNPPDLVNLMGYEPVVPVDEADPVPQILKILQNPEVYQDLVQRNWIRVGEVGTWKSRSVAMRSSILTIVDEWRREK